MFLFYETIDLISWLDVIEKLKRLAYQCLICRCSDSLHIKGIVIQLILAVKILNVKENNEYLILINAEQSFKTAHFILNNIEVYYD